MTNKRKIMIRIFCNNLPFTVSVYDECGYVMQRMVTNSKSYFFDACVYGRLIIKVAISNQRSITYFVKRYCNYIALNFLFNEPLTSENNFILLDANYGLPLDGTLNFNSP